MLREAGVADDYAGHFEAEHRRLEGLLETAGSEGQAATALVELLDERILREETDMFPAARQLLDAAQWDAVDEAVSDAAAR